MSILQQPQATHQPQDSLYLLLWQEGLVFLFWLLETKIRFYPAARLTQRLTQVYVIKRRMIFFQVKEWHHLPDPWIPTFGPGGNPDTGPWWYTVPGVPRMKACIRPQHPRLAARLLTLAPHHVGWTPDTHLGDRIEISKCVFKKH